MGGVLDGSGTRLCRQCHSEGGPRSCVRPGEEQVRGAAAAARRAGGRGTGRPGGDRCAVAGRDGSPRFDVDGLYA